MNNRLIESHEADVWIKSAWLRVIQVQQRPRQLAASAAAHSMLNDFFMREGQYRLDREAQQRPQGGAG